MKHLRTLTCSTKPLLGHGKQQAESRRASRGVSNSTAVYAGKGIFSKQETTTKSKTPDMSYINHVFISMV